MGTFPTEKHTFEFPIDTLSGMRDWAEQCGTGVPQVLWMGVLRYHMLQKQRDRSERIRALLAASREAAIASASDPLALPKETVTIQMPTGIGEELTARAQDEAFPSVEAYLIASFGVLAADEAESLANP